ncbi:AlwI family type II restriction endonuclease [Pasteurella caecimuris]|uniref:AlwI family type II restriction endonuclease n=1 Tax=Rodentibacter caecimuris TaxID=1796644 RepID=UPI0021503589|nr:AlwI family type II restriction endonuclease [Pasteurella caecimuris]MCR1837221.1 AlwI family type II restriction endonuclease [Pasteurella caecimuris]MCU0106276.1 AlwI family type II restriction endonuclease [Pasteurella caecimuris]
MIIDIPYKSFCWVVGTTSFRTAQLNLKTEQQLKLLSDFQKNYSEWKWDKYSQPEYYNWLHKNSFVKGEASNKAKDAREKTSGLVDIGLLSKDRKLTEASQYLLSISENNNFSSENIFNIEQDSYAYLLQLLKTSLSVGENKIRPYIVLAMYLNKLDYLTFDEFRYLLPITTSQTDFDFLIGEIPKLRNKETTLNDILFNHLMRFENYQNAQKALKKNEVSEALICSIGMNRKSKNYDKPYFSVYQLLKELSLNRKDLAFDLLQAIDKLKQPKSEWKKLLFNTHSKSVVKKKGIQTIQESNPFFECKNEQEFKEAFFKYMHLFKAVATLKDYFDLNRRYLSLTDTIIFDDEIVKFDVIAKYFFKLYDQQIKNIAFKANINLEKNVSIEKAISIENIDIQAVYNLISQELGIEFKTPQQVSNYIHNERQQRFNLLIDKKFNDKTLVELLHCFENRNDDRIRELVTDNAEIYSIFEYIIGIIWYKVSEKQGDILDYMQLSLDAQLLPKSHAKGGEADIVYKYQSTQYYPEHTLLIEPTLADGNNQRRMEMEPVSRHLGEYRLRSNNPNDYSLFVSTFLHKNVISDFRFRKMMPYYGKNDTINGLKIISLDTQSLKSIIENKVYYKKLYATFEKYHQQEISQNVSDWYDNLVQEAGIGGI